MSMSTQALCKDTPTVHVFDSRGSTVRVVEYNRSVAGETAKPFATRHTYDAAGRLVSSTDPRFLALQEKDSTVHGNERHRLGLSGIRLCRQSRDAGWRVEVPDASGQPFRAYDPNGRTWRWVYDAMCRRTDVMVKEGTSPERCTEKLVYGDPGVLDHRAVNLVGRVMQHWHTAGLSQSWICSILGGVKSMGLSCLADAEWSADWTPPSNEWTHKVKPIDSTTIDRNAFDEEVGRSDARSSTDTRYLLSGRLASLELTVGRQVHVMQEVAEYAADGKCILEKFAGGAVERASEYDGARRLKRRKCTRVSGNKVLQDLNYVYDAVGNVLSVEDISLPPVYFRNQRVDARRTFAYDARYRLIEATGREHSSVGREGHGLPAAIVPLPSNANALLKYTRTYSYDDADNVVDVSHVGATHYTRPMVVSSESNRCVPQRDSAIPPAGVDAMFDACGNLIDSEGGWALTWDAYGRLSRATLSTRKAGVVAEERYGYGEDGRRVRKWSTAGGKKSGDVHYGHHAVAYFHEEQARRRVLNVAEWLNVELDLAATAGAARRDLSRYSMNDSLGSSVLEFDQAGQVIAAEEYYPFGGTSFWTARTQAEADQRLYRYSGKERDATGLYDYGFRYYAPWMRRWISPDPAGTVDGLNLYAMVGNNPVSWHDPDGRERAYAGLGRTFRRGDVLYGLARPRGDATMAITAAGFRQRMGGVRAAIARLAGRQPPAHVLIQNDLTNAVWRTNHPGRYSSDRRIRSRLADGERGVLFKRFLEAHPKYNVAATPQAQAGDLSRRQWKALWKKTSKGGLEYQVSRRQATVHFVVEKLLDANAVDTIVGKLGLGQSITSSEIRWLYRHRETDAVRNHVRFWDRDREVSHAEVFDAHKWGRYVPKNRYEANWGLHN